MQMRSWEFLKFAIVFGLVGLVVAGGIAFRMQDQYASSGIVALPPDANPSDLQRAETYPFYWRSLVDLVIKEDLYPDERQRIPMEDVIQTMRSRDIRTTVVRRGS